MARILISYFSSSGEVMYDSLCESLLQNGNKVFRLNICNPGIGITDWAGESFSKDSRLEKMILNFKPEIILDFSNTLPPELVENISDCQTFLLDGDVPEFYFFNRKYLRSNPHNFKYLGFTSSSMKLYNNFFCKEVVTPDQFLYFPAATSVVSENLEKTTKISFIGSNFYPEFKSFVSSNSFQNIEAYKAIKMDFFAKNPFISNEEFEYMRRLYVGQDRIKFLSVLSDLGLEIYGPNTWKQSFYIDLNFLNCYKGSNILTLKDNQDLYNKSILSVNISHPQAVDAFSWRVMDIMASSSCLLTEDKKDWHFLFDDYISKEVREAIIYEDQEELRSKAKLLLSDAKLRKMCVESLNFAIQQNGRWRHRLLSLQDFSRIKLIGNNSPEIVTINKNNFYQMFPNEIKSNPTFVVPENRNSKKRIKLMGALAILSFSFIPFFGSIIPPRVRESLYKKIKKNLEGSL